MGNIENQAAVTVVVSKLEVDVALVLVDFMNKELELREGYEDEWLACEVGRRPDVVPVSRSGSAMHVSDAGSRVLFLERSSCQKVGESRHMRQEHACGQSFNTTTLAREVTYRSQSLLQN